MKNFTFTPMNILGLSLVVVMGAILLAGLIFPSKEANALDSLHLERSALMQRNMELKGTVEEYNMNKNRLDQIDDEILGFLSGVSNEF